jgi:putative ABC transport system permease protein
MQVYRDLAYALRTLRKRPVFSSVVIAALALCIGANTAIFTLVDSVLLRELPFKQPNRLVAVYEILADIVSGPIPFSAPDYVELLRRNHSFESVGIYGHHEFELSGTDQPMRLRATRISASLWPTLGVSPALGRNLTAEEDRNGARVAILSAKLWRSRFGGDRGMIGKNVLLDRVPYTVVGVMPDGWEFPLHGPAYNNEPAQIYVPISFTKDELQGFGNMYNHSVVARLRPGVTVQQAQEDVKAIAKRTFDEVYPAALRGSGFHLDADLRPLRDEIVGKVKPVLLVLLGAVSLVLLIGCADIASLLLARAASRQREMSVRVALGARRADLIRQILSESLVLAVVGGGLGLLLSVWATKFMLQIGSIDLPETGAVHVDWRVLTFTLALSAVTAVLFGLFPAWQASQAEVNEGLREGGRAHSASRKQGRTLGALVTVQFALALVLLVGAGLLLRSFSRLLATNPGFRPDHVLTMSVSLPAQAYKTGSQVRNFYQRLQPTLEGVPGVKAAAIATSLPLSINEHRTFSIEGQNPATIKIPRSVAHIWPLGNFFSAMGIPLKRGRVFDRRDTKDSLPVALVSETLARRFWPGENPIGKRIKWGENNSKDPWMTIVGVVADVKQDKLNERTESETYVPYLQIADDDLADSVTNEFRSLRIVVRTAADPVLEASAIRRKIHRLDPSLPVTDVKTMQAALHESTHGERFNTILLASFAMAALLLAALGIAGVLAHSVSQRISEIGVRMALGARKTDVFKLVLKRGMTMALLGAAIGLACSVAVAGVMSRLLYETSPYDPWTLLAAPVVLCLVALLSIWIPAGRAAAIDPIQALRVE